MREGPCDYVVDTRVSELESPVSLLRQEYFPGEDILRHLVLVERDLVLAPVETGVARRS